MSDARKTRTIRGESHQLVILRVHNRDHLERPRECRIIYSTDMGLDDEDVFIEAWVPSRLVAEQRKPSN